MVGAADVLSFLLVAFLYLFLPLGLMAILFGLSQKYRGMFDAIGFSRKEMGLLIVGSLSMLFVPDEVPVVVYQQYFLAVNLGGAIIPTVLSIHLLRSKHIPWLVWAPGVLAVSAITFLITRVQPNAGIVAEFPYMFLPALTGAFLALLLYGRSSPRAPAFAYASATLGSLIGADVYHMPELFQTEAFVGSIGGAGVFDLVYIGGLVSVALALLFTTSQLRRLRATLPHAELARERVLSELRNAATALMMGQYQLSAQRSLAAVQERLRQVGHAFGRGGAYPDVLYQLLPDPNPSQAYHLIARYANAALLDFYSARWALQSAQGILQRLQAVERTRYAGPGRRTAAFLVDAALMTILLATVVALVYAGGSALADPVVLFLGVFFWAFTIQVLYFTVFEYYWKGQSPGKRLLGLRVLELNDRPPDFITAFTRNTVRLLDFVLVGYLVSLLLIASSPRAQRIGDRIADTVVVREVAGPPPVQ